MSSYRNHVSAIAELSAFEGVFTTAQAARLGIPRNALSQAVSAGRLDRIMHGAYRMVGTFTREIDEVTALWKLTDPAKFTHERMYNWDGIVVGGSTAASIHFMGTFWLSPYRIYAPRRINSRYPSARFARRIVDPKDVTWLDGGLPVTKPLRTLHDLIDDFEDLSLVERAVDDVAAQGVDVTAVENRIDELMTLEVP